MKKAFLTVATLVISITTYANIDQLKAQNLVCSIGGNLGNDDISIMSHKNADQFKISSGDGETTYELSFADGHNVAFVVRNDGLIRIDLKNSFGTTKSVEGRISSTNTIVSGQLSSSATDLLVAGCFPACAEWSKVGGCQNFSR